MRVVLPTGNKTRRNPPPIPLERPEKVELQKGEYLSLKLQSTPGDANSQTYELSIPYYGSGTPEQWLKFKRDLNRVLVGQNITTGPPKFAMARRLLEGDALSKFNERAQANGAETSANFTATLQEVTTHVFPKKALALQKRYMRRFMRKPRELKTRPYVARVMELNAFLRLFPPYGMDQALPQEELMDIFEFSMPASWQKQAIIQGFDIMQHTPNEFVEFCERLEGVEDDPEAKTNKESNEKKSQKNNKFKKRTKPTESNEDKPVCMLHGPGHSTDECKVLKTQAKRMKASYDAQSSDGKKNWKKKNETNAIIQAVVEKLQGSKRKKGEEAHISEVDFSNLRVSSDSEASSDSNE